MSAILTTLFTEQSIQFHLNDLDTNLVPVPISDAKFGILNLKSVSSPLTEETLEFIFQIDRSGSMRDRCLDGRTKMEHIIHTLNNIVNYFLENRSLKVFITVEAFDDLLYTIVERTNITEENYREILTKIDGVTPKNNTDIGKALTRVNRISADLKSQFPDHKIVHIFMTDGVISQGVTNHKILSKLIDRDIINAFIGFGFDHDASVMNALSDGPNSSYYFIDKLENAGFVYGEILHGVVYRFLTDVVITINEGLIYNFKTNEWATSLAVGEIVSESNKTYHIISNNPSMCSAELTFRKVVDNIEDNIVILREEDVDLTKYIFRQRTQQHLYRAKEFITKNRSEPDMWPVEQQIDSTTSEKQQLKIQLTDYLTELKKFMTDNSLMSDPFYTNLCDDIYISIKTFSTNYGEMYVNARLTSQGTQRAYNVTKIPEIVERSCGITRQNACGWSNNNFDDEEDTIDHEVSTSVTTPYRSASQTGVMRSISNTTAADIEEPDVLEIQE